MDIRDTLEQAVFIDARRITDAADRERFIVQACGGNAQLEHRIRSLLRVDAEETSTLETPVAASSAIDLVQGVAEAVESKIGPYELITQLGAGGMGLVFLARQVTPIHRQVALKIIRPGMNTRIVIQRFETERQTLAQLNHPGIARLLDAGTTDSGRHWFVMELVQGLPITEFCRQQSLSIPDRLRLFELVCDAVHHAHQNGVIHRDIKPSNIVITNMNGRPVPKVIDFGVAKVTPQEMSCECHQQLPGNLLSTTIVGTPSYMSPEQTVLPDGELDARCDVYSLGMLLYELLTDSKPFAGVHWQDAGYSETRRIIREVSPLIPSEQVLLSARTKETERAARSWTASEGKRDPRRLSTSLQLQRLSAELRGDLDWITTKAIEKDRDRRYSSVAELAADIRRHLNHEPVAAARSSSWYCLKKFVRRHRSRIAVITLTLGTLLLLADSLVNSMLLSDARLESRKNEELVQEQKRKASAQEAALRGHEYANAFHAAWAAYLRGDLTETRQRLQQCAIDGGGNPALRFEWNYLNRLCIDRSRMLRGDRGKVFDVEFSPDGRLMASCTGGDNCCLQIWDAASGSLVHSIRDFESDVNSLCFSVDGKWLLTGEEVCRIRVWDVASWREVSRLEGFNRPIGQIHLAADMRTVIAAQIDWKTRQSTTVVRDLQTLAVGTVLERHRLLDVCEPQKLVALVSDDGEVSLRNFPDLSLFKTLPEKLPGTCCGSFSNKAGLFACGSAQGGVRIWTLSDARETTLPPHGLHPNGVRDISFSQDDRFLITAFNDGVIEIRDVATRTMQVVFHAGFGEAWSIGVAPDFSRFSVGYQDGHVQISQWADILQPRRSIIQSESPFSAVTSDADGSRLAMIDSSQTAVTVYSTESGQCLKRVEAPADDHFSSVLFAADGESLWLMDERGKLLNPDLENKELHRRFSMYSGQLTLPVLSPAGEYFAVSTSVTDPGQSGIWHRETGKEVFRLPTKITEEADGPHRVFAFCSDDTILTVQGRTATRWNFRTGQEIGPRFQESGIWISFASPLPDQNTAAIGLFDGTVHLWDFATQQSRAILQGHEPIPTCCAISPDQQTLATASASGQVRLWHLNTALPLCELHGLTGEVLHLWFAADGKRLFATAKTVDGGGEVMVWDATNETDKR